MRQGTSVKTGMRESVSSNWSSGTFVWMLDMPHMDLIYEINVQIILVCSAASWRQSIDKRTLEHRLVNNRSCMVRR